MFLPFPGIDINAGCGQLKSELLRKKKSSCGTSPVPAAVPAAATTVNNIVSDAVSSETIKSDADKSFDDSIAPNAN